MATNHKILNAWKNGKSCGKFGHRLNTDGDALLSYREQIGFTNEHGEKLLFIYTAKTGNFISRTTSKHCELARRSGVADEVFEMSYEQYDLIENKIVDILTKDKLLIKDIAEMVKNMLYP